jgi:dynactin-6
LVLGFAILLRLQTYHDSQIKHPTQIQQRIVNNMSSKRASMLPPAPKPPTSLSSSLVIAEHASLTGTKLITLGSNTVVHPRSKLNSAFAPITIGNTCIISERSQIGVQSEPEEGEADPVVIENGVVVEVGAVVEAKRVGEGCVIEVNAKIGKGAVLGKVCRLSFIFEAILISRSIVKLDLFVR